MQTSNHSMTENIHTTENITQRIASNAQMISFLKEETQQLEKQLASLGKIESNNADLWEDWNAQISQVIKSQYPDTKPGQYTFELYCRINKSQHMDWEILMSNNQPVPRRRITLHQVNLPRTKTPIWEKALMFGIREGYYTCVEL